MSDKIHKKEIDMVDYGNVAATSVLACGIAIGLKKPALLTYFCLGQQYEEASCPLYLGHLKMKEKTR